jgi:hypothetical protein
MARRGGERDARHAQDLQDLLVGRFVPGETPGIIQAGVQAPCKINSAGHDQPPFLLVPEWSISDRSDKYESVVFPVARKIPGARKQIARSMPETQETGAAICSRAGRGARQRKTRHANNQGAEAVARMC